MITFADKSEGTFLLRKIFGKNNEYINVVFKIKLFANLYFFAVNMLSRRVIPETTYDLQNSRMI